MMKYKSKRMLLAFGALACLAVAVSCYLGLRYAQTAGAIGDIRIHRLPLRGDPYSVTISPDGSTVATLGFVSGAPADAIEIWDVTSGHEVNKVYLPKVSWDKGGQLRVSPLLQFCDQGKYLAAFDRLNKIYIIDTKDYTVHAAIALAEIPVGLHQGGTPRPLREVSGYNAIELSCSAGSAFAALRVWMNGKNVVKVFDFDAGAETADLTESFDGIQGDGVAISPDGSKVAADVWNMQPAGPYDEYDEVAEVVDRASGKLIQRLDFGDRKGLNRYQLSFSGENALVVGLPLCQKVMCDDSVMPYGRTIRVLEPQSKEQIKTFGAEGAEAYRFSGASADGREVFGYTGVEKFCRDCNGVSGELKITNARFTVWDRESGKILVRSPKLRVQQHKCHWLVLGACEDSESVPDLQLSDNGKSVVALWPNFDRPGQDKLVGEIQVFSWR